VLSCFHVLYFDNNSKLRAKSKKAAVSAAAFSNEVGTTEGSAPSVGVIVSAGR